MLVPPLCWGCGETARRGEPLCWRCRSRVRRLASQPVLLSGIRVWAPVAYSGPARDLVRALKFSAATRVADAMAAQIAANAPAGMLAGAGSAGRVVAAPPPVLVPVPLHPRRLRVRGYNQAAVIAEALSRRTGLAVLDCLVRSGSAATQVGRHRAERRAGPAGSVELAREQARRPPLELAREWRRRPPLALLPARVLLVDDVATTGGTLAACAAVLAAERCLEVAAVTFARTIGR